MWSNVVEETGEPGENHRTWTGDHYPATCLDPDSNPDRSGDKRVRRNWNTCGTCVFQFMVYKVDR